MRICVYKDIVKIELRIKVFLILKLYFKDLLLIKKPRLVNMNIKWKDSGKIIISQCKKIIFEHDVLWRIPLCSL